MNQKMKRILPWAAVAACLAAVAGCTYPGDSSGFKAEEKPSKDKIQAQIADVKANPKIPDHVKAVALKKLEKDLADAK